MVSLLIASALTIGHIPEPPRNSTMWYDNQIQLTQRVLDRTIDEDIERVQYGNAEAVSDAMRLKAKRHKASMVSHCWGTLGYLSLPQIECGEKTRQ